MRYVDGVTTKKKISVIGLGTWQFGSREWGYGAVYAASEAPTIVRRALELGVTLFDTAEVYGFGRSERILGSALREAGALETSFVATKLFPALPVAPVVEQRAVASANRLGVRQIDLYQVHQPHPLLRDTTTMRGMAALQRVGLVDAVGVSNYSLERWQAAEEALGAAVLSNQVEFSLLQPRAERDLLPHAVKNDRLIIAYSPLAMGVLSGRYTRERRPTSWIRTSHPLFLPSNLDAARPVLNVLRDVAAAHDASPAQIALAWVIRHPNVVAIPGASSVAQLESNVAAADIELTDEEYGALKTASDAFEPTAGGRARAAAILRGWPRRR
ncbi:aldo/keto reductase [Candidatus Protofrankia californiensis]|uniref:aldo/keto reductase n=1 Tax=Candidatus Protofrankia californiensis TaxID=1839754 RepID=UPI00104133A0|nr:aldo/keto reductase [Candidatus Protofrankia californiensis]